MIGPVATMGSHYYIINKLMNKKTKNCEGFLVNRFSFVNKSGSKISKESNLNASLCKFPQDI